MTFSGIPSRGVFSSAFVRQCLPGCSVLGKEPDAYLDIVTDSRTVGAGEVFVALKGDNFDGHDFVGDVVAKGVSAVICRKDFAAVPKGNVAFYRVDDPLEAYRRIAAAWRAKFSIPLAVVAGAVGKTTTKELLAACLRGGFLRVLKTEGSRNGFIGIPMTLLRLREEDAAAVIEIGIDDIGAMEKHLEIVRPTVAVVTAIGPEHLENLKDIDTVAREECLSLTWTARNGGRAVVNLDDPDISKRAPSGPGTLAYTLGPQKAGAVIAGSVDGAGVLTIQGEGLDGLRLPSPLLGLHNARNLLAAVAVARAMGVDAAAIAKGLETFEAPSGRSALRELPGGIRVFCDYYNASPPSVRAGLEVLGQLGSAAKGTAWACLADMLELGPEELRFHRDLAEPVLRSGAKKVLLFGPRMKALEEELRARRFSGDARHFETIESLGEALTSAIRSGDVVLIKGSRGMKMERVFQALETAKGG